MIKKRILNPGRIRQITGGFSYIPHRFLRVVFSLPGAEEILLYLFLILVSDRYGLSYYSYDMICSLIQLTLDEYIEARDGLLREGSDQLRWKDFPGPRSSRPAPSCAASPSYEDPAVVARMIRQSLQEARL